MRQRRKTNKNKDYKEGKIGTGRYYNPFSMRTQTDVQKELNEISERYFL